MKTGMETVKERMDAVKTGIEWIGEKMGGLVVSESDSEVGWSVCIIRSLCHFIFIFDILHCKPVTIGLKQVLLST